MIRIEKDAWDRMVAHARSAYPDECCGAMLGAIDNSHKTVKVAVELENAYQGERGNRYELRPEDLLRADREARRQGLDLIGIFHSHPDADAYFSATDLKNSCPWYSFVVLSVKGGEFDHAACYLPNADQTAADSEELVYPN
ncbi:MAG: M67 family metallopeptidase [Bryobacteraceae bacterium]|nr:M67 family metallopeptidase [Bryobacteraceae bacterium]